MAQISRQDPTEFTRRVRAAQELAGCSTLEIARALGISTKSVLRTLRGQRKARAGELRTLAELLGVKESFLLGHGELDDARVMTVTAAITLIADLRSRLDETKALLESALAGAGTEDS